MANKQINELPAATSAGKQDLLHIKTSAGTDKKLEVRDFLETHHYNTIALAKADTNLKVGNRVKTWGYTSVGDGGGAEYVVVAAATGTDDGGSFHDMSNGNQLQLITEIVSPKMFGAEDGSTTVDSQSAIQNCLKYCAQNNIVCDWSGDFRIDDSVTLDTDYDNLNTIGRMKLRLYGTFAANKAGFHIPANGDNYGGLATGGSNMRLGHVEVDCSNASVTASQLIAGVAIYGGQRNTLESAVGHDALKVGVTLGSQTGQSFTSVRIGTAIGYNNDDGSQTAGQGVSISSDLEDDDIEIDNIIAYSNAIWGVDFSTGICKVKNLYSYSNGDAVNGGGGFKVAGSGSNETIIDTLVCRDNVNEGILTNAAQKIFSVRFALIRDNGTQGAKIAHDGIYDFGHYYAEGNTNNGIQVTAGHVHIDTLQADGNGANAALCTGGDLHIGFLDSENHSSGAGCVFSSTGALTIEKAASNEDLNGAVRVTGSTTQATIGDIEVDHSSSAAPGLFANSNPSGIKVGKITALNSAVEIDDSSTNIIRERPTAEDSISAGTPQTQAGATQLAAQFNRVTTVSTASDGVKLPTAVPGLIVTIRNDDSTDALQVWPNTSDSIDNGATDAADANTLAAGAARTYQAISASKWFTISNT